MQKVDGMFVLPTDMTIQTRRAQNLSPTFGNAIRRFCEANSNIEACFVLDARRPNTEALALIVAVTVDGGQNQLVSLASQFQAMRNEFPEEAENTFLMSSERFVDTYAGYEFYVRKAT